MPEANSSVQQTLLS
ncbi:hypothetical protein A2U01_0116122, partial [Trifolium medium]|nr:hypothetical protein [Trifolium medium]